MQRLLLLALLATLSCSAAADSARAGFLVGATVVATACPPGVTARSCAPATSSVTKPDSHAFMGSGSDGTPRVLLAESTQGTLVLTTITY